MPALPADAGDGTVGAEAPHEEHPTLAVDPDRHALGQTELGERHQLGLMGLLNLGVAQLGPRPLGVHTDSVREPVQRVGRPRPPVMVTENPGTTAPLSARCRLADGDLSSHK